MRMYRRTKDCTAMILYNDEVAELLYGIPGGTGA